MGKHSTDSGEKHPTNDRAEQRMRDDATKPQPDKAPAADQGSRDYQPRHSR